MDQVDAESVSMGAVLIKFYVACCAFLEWTEQLESGAVRSPALLASTSILGLAVILLFYFLRRKRTSAKIPAEPWQAAVVRISKEERKEREGG